MATKDAVMTVVVAMAIWGVVQIVPVTPTAVEQTVLAMRMVDVGTSALAMPMVVVLTCAPLMVDVEHSVPAMQMGVERSAVVIQTVDVVQIADVTRMGVERSAVVIPTGAALSVPAILILVVVHNADAIQTNADFNVGVTTTQAVAHNALAMLTAVRRTAPATPTTNGG